MFETAIIHIGPNKTGTSSIQNTLDHNRAALKAAGFYYPHCPERSYFIASHFLEDPNKIFGNIYHLKGEVAEIRARDNEIIASLNRRASQNKSEKLLLSSEWLNALSIKELTDLKEYLETIAQDIQIVAYIRDPLKHRVSLLQQNVWINGECLDFSNIGTNHYKNIYETFTTVLSPSQFIAHKFSKDSLTDGCVVADFLSTSGMSESNLKHIDIQNENEARSHEALLVADAYNRLLPLKIDGSYNHERSIIPIIARLHGTKFKIDAATAQKLQRALQDEYTFIHDTFGFSFGDETYPEKAVPQWSRETLDTLVYAFHKVERENISLKSEVLHLKAQHALQGNNANKAEELLIEALKIDTSNFVALDMLLNHLEATNRQEDAIAVSYEFYKLNKSSSSHAFACKSRLLKAGLRDEARLIVKEDAPQKPRVKLAK